jgi:hypothetical protein
LRVDDQRFRRWQIDAAVIAVIVAMAARRVECEADIRISMARRVECEADSSVRPECSIACGESCVVG